MKFKIYRNNFLLEMKQMFPIITATILGNHELEVFWVQLWDRFLIIKLYPLCLSKLTIQIAGLEDVQFTQTMVTLSGLVFHKGPFSVIRGGAYVVLHWALDPQPTNWNRPMEISRGNVKQQIFWNPSLELFCETGLLYILLSSTIDTNAHSSWRT